MKTDLGDVDRFLRIVIGLGLLGAGAHFRIWWGLVGLLPIITAAIGWCPAYLPLGLSTCKGKGE